MVEHFLSDETFSSDEKSILLEMKELELLQRKSKIQKHLTSFTNIVTNLKIPP